MLFGSIAAVEGGAMTVPEFLFVLIAILASAKVLGELAERIGQPAVLGELLAGVLLGPSMLGFVDPGVPIVHLLAEIGVIILLFEIGLETDLRRLAKVGGASAAVAIVGVVLPFALGYGVAILFDLETLQAVVAGAALTATSVGITARVLADLGRLQEPESQIVLGAAVIDDVIGLIILAVISGLVAGAGVSVGSVALTTVIAFGFIAAVLLFGRLLIPPVFGFLARIGRPDTLATMALIFAFLAAYLADLAGSAVIIGAFAAGLVLQPTEHAKTIEHGVVALGYFFVPIFFVAVGAAVDVGSFMDPGVMSIGASLIVVAVIGKVAAGYAAFWTKAKKIVIGVGMVPRGEVGLIFAQMGLTAGVLDVGLFSGITLMVMVTTFLAPPWLKIVFPPVPGPRRDVDLRGVAESTSEA